MRRRGLQHLHVRRLVGERGAREQRDHRGAEAGSREDAGLREHADQRVTCDVVVRRDRHRHAGLRARARRARRAASASSTSRRNGDLATARAGRGAACRRLPCALLIWWVIDEGSARRPCARMARVSRTRDAARQALRSPTAVGAFLLTGDTAGALFGDRERERDVRQLRTRRPSGRAPSHRARSCCDCRRPRADTCARHGSAGRSLVR